jgi:hypothetical protein
MTNCLLREIRDMRRPRSVSARGTGVSSECKELFREIRTLCESRGLLGTNLRWRYHNLDKPGRHVRFHRLPASSSCALVAASIGLSVADVQNVATGNGFLFDTLQVS